MAFVIAGRFAALLHHLNLTTDELLGEAACREILANAHVTKGIVGAVGESILDGPARRTLALRGVQPDASAAPRTFAQRSVPDDYSATPRASAPDGVRHDASASPRSSAPHGVSGNASATSRASSPRDVRRAAPVPLCSIPLQAIVGGTTHDRLVPGVVVRHYSGSLPAGSIMHVSPDLGFGDDVYVASPELLFVLGAAGRDVAGAAAWGMELCGTYAQSDDDDWPCIYQLKPIATVASLSAFISTYVDVTQPAIRPRGRAVSGLATARHALPYVIERSASPMETKLACLLGLSTRLGGRGLWPIEFNARLDLDDAARRVAGKSYLSLDLFFRQELRPGSGWSRRSGGVSGSGGDGGSSASGTSGATSRSGGSGASGATSSGGGSGASRATSGSGTNGAIRATSTSREGGGEARWMPVAVEYESREFHEAVAAVRDPLDRNRMTAAELSGVRMLPLTWEIVRDETRFDAFCDELARLLGKVPRPVGERTLARRRRVRAELGLPVWSHDDDLVPVDAYDLY